METIIIEEEELLDIVKHYVEKVKGLGEVKRIFIGANLANKTVVQVEYEDKHKKNQ
jgi:hypothetical protein